MTDVKHDGPALDYVKATDLAHAVRLVALGGVALAGGTVLVPEVAGGALSAPLVDLRALAELRLFRRDGDRVEAGALLTIAELGERLDVRSAALQREASLFGNPYVRRAATLGGSLARGRSTLFPSLLALDAEVTIQDSLGAATLPVARLVGRGLPPRTLLVGVAWKVPADLRSAAASFAPRGEGSEPRIGVAAALRLEGGAVVEARFAVGDDAGARRLVEVERRLLGAEASVIEEAARIASSSMADRLARAIVERATRDALGALFA